MSQMDRAERTEKKAGFLLCMRRTLLHFQIADVYDYLYEDNEMILLTAL